MKRTLLIAGSATVGMLLWIGLRSDSAAPLPSSEPTARPVVQQKLSAHPAGTSSSEQTIISKGNELGEPQADGALLPPTNDGASAPALDSAFQQSDATAIAKPRIKKSQRKEGEPNELLTESISIDSMESTGVTAAVPPQPPFRPLPSIRYPLALQEISPDVAISPTIKAGLTENAENFITSVGGEDQDANDPDYRARWRTMQPKADQHFKTLYGIQAWLKLQNSTTHDASQPPPESNSADSETP